jgi:ABC-type transport system involved in multi-copper enzyme maturation permease subunit
MVWIALGLLGLSTTMVGVNTLANRWGMDHWRSPRGIGPSFRDWLDVTRSVPWLSPASSVGTAFTGSCQALLAVSGFFVFSNWIVFSVFIAFLLPVWSLSFASEALGSERENRTLIWLLIQPVGRPALYLGKFLSLLPFTLGLNLGGFALLCVAAGTGGRMALSLFWPAVFWGTLAFSALFHLMAACFRRPALVGIVYSFFLEMVLGNMPGTMKRASIGYYVRCMMFESAKGYGLQPEKPSVYLPVSGTTATWVLAAATVLFLGLGAIVFSRLEYSDLN